MMTFDQSGFTPTSGLKSLFSERQFWLSLIFTVIVFLSAVSVIYVQAMDRLMFSHLQQLQKTRDALRLEWGQLLLEQSTWATQARIEHKAQRDMAMVFPAQNKIVMVTE